MMVIMFMMLMKIMVVLVMIKVNMKNGGDEGDDFKPVLIIGHTGLQIVSWLSSKYSEVNAYVWLQLILEK